MTEGAGDIIGGVVVGLLILVTGIRLVTAGVGGWWIVPLVGLLTFVIGGPVRWELEGRVPLHRREELRVALLVVVIMLGLLGLTAGVLSDHAVIPLVDAVVMGMLIGVLVVLGLDRLVRTRPSPYMPG